MSMQVCHIVEVLGQLAISIILERILDFADFIMIAKNKGLLGRGHE